MILTNSSWFLYFLDFELIFSPDWREEKIALLTALFATNDQEKSNLIYDYFLNKDLASAQELLTQEVVLGNRFLLNSFYIFIF